MVLGRLLVLDAGLVVKLTFNLRRTRGVQVGGWPAYPRLADLELLPPRTDFGVDAPDQLLMVVMVASM
jgi:hypothetical protein